MAGLPCKDDTVVTVVSLAVVAAPGWTYIINDNPSTGIYLPFESGSVFAVTIVNDAGVTGAVVLLAIPERQCYISNPSK